MTYAEKLKDPRWQKKRLEILNRDEFTCRKCKSKENTLHIHHLFYYDRECEIEPWDYDNTVLITLCCDCHELIREEQKFYENEFKQMIYGMGISPWMLWGFGVFLSCNKINEKFHQALKLYSKKYDKPEEWFENYVSEFLIENIPLDV